MSPLDDDASADEAGGAIGLDLSPRTPRAGRAGRSGKARWPWLVVLVVIVAGISFVISRALTDATQYYLTAPEAVARRAELGGRTFRLEGAVVEGSQHRTAGAVSFKVAADRQSVEVQHRGDPPALFQDCIPVVVEGHWNGDVFESNLMIIAHDEKYEEQNSARIQQARAQGDPATGACAVNQGAP